MTSVNPAFDRGPSDFDIRHQLTGLVSYELPAAVSTRPWKQTVSQLGGGFDLQRSLRETVERRVLVPTSFGVAYLRPDVVSGSAVVCLRSVSCGWTKNESGGICCSRGFAAGQICHEIVCEAFRFTRWIWHCGGSSTSLKRSHYRYRQTRSMFSIIANFEDPMGNDLVVGRVQNLAFGQSTAMSGRSLSGGGFPSFYSFGGPRTMRFSVKLVF